jgi:hypothetical protein
MEKPRYHWKFAGNYIPDNTVARIKTVKSGLSICDAPKVSPNPVIYFIPATTEHVALQTVLHNVAQGQNWDKHHISSVLDVCKHQNFPDNESSLVLSFKLNEGEMVALTLEFNVPFDDGAWKTMMENVVIGQAKEINEMKNEIQDLHLLISDLYGESEDDNEVDKIDNATIQLLKKRKLDRN